MNKYHEAEVIAERQKETLERQHQADLKQLELLIEYALLEEEYSILCDRRQPDWHAANLHSWAKKHKIGTEPVGQWLGRKRTAALGNALRKE